VSSKALDNFNENRKDLAQLWQIHEEIAGQTAGRKYGVDVINRAAIVFITACWESFVEDIALEAFDFLVANAPNALALPPKVRNLATKPIFEQKDSTKVWDLADSGWRLIISQHRTATIERWINTLNTPKSAQDNTLFEELLGIANLKNEWHWQHMSPTQAQEKLDRYIKVRGNIAHRTEHDNTVYKNWITDYLGHVEYLVNITEAKLSAHVSKLTGKKPF
jgi:hypothetical protein